MSKFRYRPEIDGLRAVSVLGVVFFHANLGFSGGFVGVDVFFVISGFLITSIILKEIGEGRFLLSEFWVRRIRRILPAAAFLVISVLLVGLLLLDPVTLRSVSKAAISQALMSSNFFFWQDVDYFAESADLKPLLHTWSLSVEEQFYLILPPLAYLFSRANVRWFPPFLFCVFLLSFGVSIYSVESSPGSAFYLLPSRAWEMLAGSLLAMYGNRLELNRKTAELLGGAGLCMIFVAMVMYKKGGSFPGVAALVPVFGAVIFIWANQAKRTLTGNLLAWKPLVFIGAISYSLYLWHWPILAYARLMFIEINKFGYVALVVLSIVVAIFSWKYVESPFRKRGRLKTRQMAYTFGLFTTGCVLALSVLIWRANGFPSRVGPELSTALEDIYWNGSKSNDGARVKLGVKDSDLPVDFVLWGDSHGMVLTELFDELAMDHGLNGAAFLSAGQAPVPGLFKPAKGEAARRLALDQSQIWMEEVLTMGIKHLILVGRWNAMCEGLSLAELRAVHGGSSPTLSMVADSNDLEITIENSTSAFHRQLSSMLTRLGDAGLTVWLLKQPPEAANSNIARSFYLTKRFPLLNSNVMIDESTREDFLQRGKHSERVFSSLNLGNVNFLDAGNVFFDENGILRIFGERAFYRDDDHLTRYGVDMFLRPTFENVFTQIRATVQADQSPAIK